MATTRCSMEAASASVSAKGDSGGAAAQAAPAGDGHSAEGAAEAVPSVQDQLAEKLNNEPKYCFCLGPSVGEMIGCDNPQCPIEWFHFKCVNLDPDQPPNAVWSVTPRYCPDCSKQRAA
eukprot:m.468431 g.468431  ORF g.468431 m.468431 type:complete len:119 (+) comp27473_c0_seq1:120-476(+)